MKRKIKFENFRNLGIGESTSLLLNHSIDGKHFGDLIILIGENNSGKSNVLDGIEILKTHSLSNRDKTTLNYDPKCEPSISFEVSDKNMYASFTLSGFGPNGKAYVKYNEHSKPKLDFKKIRKSLEELVNKSSNSPYFNVTKLNEYLNSDDLDFAEHLNEILGEARNVFSPTLNRSKAIAFNNLKGSLTDDEIVKILEEQSNDQTKVENYLQKTYGITFMPTIIKYNEKPISSNLLNSEPSQLKNNPLLCSVLEAIGINKDEIMVAYEQYASAKNIAFLTKEETKINDKIKVLNRRFNSLYYTKDNSYHFSIRLQNNQISLGLARGKEKEPLVLEYQSVGFKWFFNFFFNFLYTNNIPKGSIVIMDEPATNLHVNGQIELRKFIKEYAHMSNITFIMATHSPFFIDADNYDELRIISTVDNKAKIDNSFSAVNIDDPDSLAPVKEALTIKHNVIYDYETEVVWVEGITDYIYLTMFKNFFGYKNIAFLPFKGVGKTDEEQTRILQKLVSIKFFKKSILIDGDKAATKFKEKCNNTYFKNRCVMISDLNTDNKKFKDIEDLFSAEDIAKYESLNPQSEFYKKSSYATAMKKTLTKEDFSEETLNNFKKLFELIR